MNYLKTTLFKFILFDRIIVRYRREKMKQYLKKRYLENSLLLLLIIFGGACKVVAAYFIGDGFNELIK